MSEVCPIFVPSIMILSTVSVVSVPSEVMLLCAAPVTVAAVPVALPSRLATIVQT